MIILIEREKNDEDICCCRFDFHVQHVDLQVKSWRQYEENPLARHQSVKHNTGGSIEWTEYEEEGGSITFFSFFLLSQKKPVSLQMLLLFIQLSPLATEDLEIDRYDKPPPNLNDAIYRVEHIDHYTLLRP